MSWLRLMEESIQENESAASADSTEIKTPAPVKKHGLSTLIKEMWPAYLIEIIVIIIGISITLALEEWRDNSKEAKLESIYLKNLQTDIAVDRQLLNGAITDTRKIIDKADQLMVLSKSNGQTDTRAHINENVKDILGRPKFIPSDATFSDLRSSGNLHLIEDIALKSLLFSYYNSVQNIKEVQEAEQAATISIAGPYFLKQFSLDPADTLFQAATTYASLISSPEFKNNVLLRLSNRKELVDLYQTADKLAAQLEITLKDKNAQ